MQELPPPTPSVTPEEPQPVRIHAPVDPNPLLQMAAAEEELFDPVHPLPEKPKRKKKAKPQPEWEDLHALSAAWRRQFSSLRQPQPPIDLMLPDYWPVAEIKHTEPPPAPRPVASMFEVLVYRPAAPAEDSISILPGRIEEAQRRIDSPVESAPPAPKHLQSRRERFTWESPEMYGD